jgi:chromosome segregation ATPase
LGEKISSLEKENKDLKKSQNEIFEKISKNEKDKDNKEGDNNALIQIFDDIKGRNTKLEDQLKNLSEDNNSLSKKLSSMEENVKEKENQISKLSEENSELKSQINELKSLIETKNKDLENLLEKNDEKINLLNNAIDQLKQSLEENRIENRKDYKLNDEKNRDNAIAKGNNDYKLSYVIVFLFICVVVIYVIYRVYYGRDEGDSRKIKHMKLSSHSGYGSISSNSFM